MSLGIIELKIKKITKRKGWTIKFLCENIGVSQAGLSYIFKQESLRIDLLMKISEFLNVDICVFFDNSMDDSKINQQISHAGNKLSGHGNIIQNGNGNKMTSVGRENVLKERINGLEKEIKGLEGQLELKDKIIGLLEKGK